MRWDVLVVEDHDDLREEVVTFLERRGMAVRAAPHAAAMDEALEERVPDVVVLDLGLPGEDGVSVAARLSRGPRPALVLFTARDRVEDRILGLNAGGDIYLVKPVDLRELEAAIAAVMRARAAVPSAPMPAEPRPVAPPPPSATADQAAAPAGAWRLDLAHWRLVAPPGGAVALSEAEVAFLLGVFETPGATVDRRDLAQRLEADARGLDLLVHRLRRKVQDAAGADLPLRTVRARGYVFLGDAEIL